MLGLLTSMFNNASAQARESQARAENYKYGEMAANNSDARTRALYNDLMSPAALLEQYKDAGLSPSLMFSGGGVGGQTQPGAQGSGATGIAPNMFGVSSPLEGAQTALALAQAKKTEAEAKQVDPLANATISSLLAEAGYKNASASCKEAERTNMELQNYIVDHTKDASIYQIMALAEKAGYEADKTFNDLKQSDLDLDFSKATYEDRLQIMHKQLEQITQAIAESKSLEKLNDRQRSKLRVDMLNSIDEINLKWKEYDLNIEQFNVFLNEQIPILKQQLEARFKELDIENKKIYVDATIEIVKGLMIGVMTASAAKGRSMGGNGNAHIDPPIKPKTRGGKALNKGVPIYKNDNVWSL